MDIRFEWDAAKSRTNQRKHGIDFDTASLAFHDPCALSTQDRIENGEVRWQTIGLVGGVLLVLVAHTVRHEDSQEVIRIISARRADPKERKRYDAQTLP
jgi:uncharacterized protein